MKTCVVILLSLLATSLALLIAASLAWDVYRYYQQPQCDEECLRSKAFHMGRDIFDGFRMEQSIAEQRPGSDPNPATRRMMHSPTDSMLRAPINTGFMPTTTKKTNTHLAVTPARGDTTNLGPLSMALTKAKATNSMPQQRQNIESAAEDFGTSLKNFNEAGDAKKVTEDGNNANEDLGGAMKDAAMGMTDAFNDLAQGPVTDVGNAINKNVNEPIREMADVFEDMGQGPITDVWNLFHEALANPIFNEVVATGNIGGEMADKENNSDSEP